LTARVAREVGRFQKIEWAGRNSFERVSCTQARKPEIGSFIRKAHMTGLGGLFKAAAAFIMQIDE
jgi:hypothetical protein